MATAKAEHLAVGDIIRLSSSVLRIARFVDYDTTDLLGFNMPGTRIAYDEDGIGVTLFPGQNWTVL